MATNGVNNVEDANMSECDGEKVVTMMDVLQEEQDFEDDANAVLGASDEKNCTYSKGYIKRQAIYACLTCCAEAKYDPTKRAGVCLACSLNCHENHELVELYTKRNFRCDCGNPKFNSHPCQFTPNKTDLNEDNKYNQNFSGLYCTCHRPYPDPESTVEDDEMIQCIVCEDWLHSLHLEAAVPGVEQYSEMICKACMERNEFLYDYSNLAVNIESETQDIDILGINSNDTKLSNGDINIENVTNATAVDALLDISVNHCNNMDVDKTQDDKTPLESDENVKNNTSETLVEESSEGKQSDVATGNIEEPFQNTSDVTADTKSDLNLETTIDESLKSSEDTVNKNSTILEENPEEVANVKSDETADRSFEKEATNVSSGQTEYITEPQETLNTPPENVEGLQDNQVSDGEKENNPEIDVEFKEPEDIIESEETEHKNELVGNKDESKKTSENDQDGASNESCEDSDTKQNEITAIPNADDIDSIAKKENTSDSNKECPDSENAELTSVTNEADSMETYNVSSETLSKSEFNYEEPHMTSSNINKPSENNIEGPNESDNKIEIEDNKEMKRKLSAVDDTPQDDHLVKKSKLQEETCIRPKEVKKVHKGATFWPSNFRQKLCTCSECLTMYKDLCVLFLIDPEDTVFAYEALGKERVDGRATQYEKGLEALSSLDRIQQINALTEYNKMKDKLLDFLKSFKDRKEVVKEEDIKAFFAGMKPKREPDGVYFCR